jgi:hypothetical protein
VRWCVLLRGCFPSRLSPNQPKTCRDAGSVRPLLGRTRLQPGPVTQVGLRAAMYHGGGRAARAEDARRREGARRIEGIMKTSSGCDRPAGSGRQRGCVLPGGAVCPPLAPITRDQLRTPGPPGLDLSRTPSYHRVARIAMRHISPRPRPPTARLQAHTTTTLDGCPSHARETARAGLPLGTKARLSHRAPNLLCPAQDLS